MFANDRKNIVRNLGKDQISVEKRPKKEATETFWRNILENDREHSHSAEWIKREEQKSADTECQPWENMSPGPDAVAVLNFWLKQLTALHQHLLNAYNQAIEQHKHIYYQRTKAQRTPKTIDQLPVYQHPTRCSHRF